MRGDKKQRVTNCLLILALDVQEGQTDLCMR